MRGMAQMIHEIKVVRVNAGSDDGLSTKKNPLL
jgi:hypothetical protein